MKEDLVCFTMELPANSKVDNVEIIPSGWKEQLFFDAGEDIDFKIKSIEFVLEKK